MEVLVKCEYCNDNAEYNITKFMQPSQAHLACKDCMEKKFHEGFMNLGKIRKDGIQ